MMENMQNLTNLQELWLKCIKKFNSQSNRLNSVKGLKYREKFKLERPQSYHYLNQSKSFALEGVSDAHEYLATRRAMDIVGIGEKEQEAIFRVVAAILHLGNIEFAKGQEIDSSVLKDEKSRFHLNVTAELLMCDAKSLEDALTKSVMVTLEEIITRTLDPEAAIGSRDTLAKTIYSRLFDWIVEKINSSIGQDPNSKSVIGVLDIHGFESLKYNMVFGRSGSWIGGDGGCIGLLWKMHDCMS